MMLPLYAQDATVAAADVAGVMVAVADVVDVAVTVVAEVDVAWAVAALASTLAPPPARRPHLMTKHALRLCCTCVIEETATFDD